MRRPRGFLVDLDGTLYEADRVVPGAPEAIARIRELGVPVRFLTNTTRVPRSALVSRLEAMGLPVSLDMVYTAPLAAAAWLRERGRTRVSLCLPPHTIEDFPGFVCTDDRPDAVVVGDLGPAWTFERLNLAFRHVLEGAELVALHRNRYWQTADGLTIDAGAYVAALEYATGAQAVVVGKPSRPMFESAAASMDLSIDQVAVVGDDIQTDIGGAQAAGAMGVLVRTGKFRPEQLDRASIQPDAVIDSIARLPEMIA